MKIREIVAMLETFHHPVDPSRTCDVFKCGDPEQECTGIAVTCFASVDVIRKAAEKGFNFIICHEPIFYSHEDKTDWLEGTPVFEAKKKLIEETGMVVWRDHDHIHSGWNDTSDCPDYIFTGIMNVLEWNDYLIESKKKPLLFEIPRKSVAELAKELTEKLHLNGARIIGDQDAIVSKVFIAEHITGRDHDSAKIIRSEKEDFDVLIPLETVDWTILEYVHDSCALGRKRAVISLGHFNFEEPGMKYMADSWLPLLLNNTVPVEFIQSGDIYSYL